ncbi:hypothetical protein ACH5RR_016903 [Cinchona calisaya]|uniref:WRKY domain-containing protein n=1 Tax=Cinchona calisaya TaxID=153742 RepID=A0ABD2ZXA0_9GENT
MANQPELLFTSCDEIIRVFSRAKESITKAQQVLLGEGSSDALLMDIVHGLPVDAKLKGVVGGSSGLEEMVGQMGGRGSQLSLESGREVEHSAEAISSGAGRGSALQGQRRRRDGGNRRVERVAAPLMGNTELPHGDGYSWRKYGQKDILNSKFPRCYFRCTHQKLYQCPAKKQVQRLDDDPNIFEVTYRGDHTCLLSSTAPSVPPPPPPPIDIIQPSAMVHPLPTSATVSLSQWLSMDIISRADPNPDGDVVGNVQIHGDYVGPTNSTIYLASGSGGGAPAGAGPSTSRGYGRDVDFQLPVADMADAMFNSGSSSNNSIDLIFSSMDDKWDSGDKKN